MTQAYKDMTPLGDGHRVADLSRLGDKLFNYEDISDDLTEQEEARVVDYIRTLIEMSYTHISGRYQHWLLADRAHDVYVRPDATQFREKAVIGTTRAIADTVVTYLMAAITGRNPMFQLEGQDRKSRRAASILERVLHLQMRRGMGEARLLQLFMDTVRYGMAPTKVIWDDNQKSNDLINFDPRRFFPDPRVSWGDWHRSNFMILSDITSHEQLVMSGQYPKVMKYPKLTMPAGSTAGWKAHQFVREKGRGFSIDMTAPKDGGTSFFRLGQARAHDEAWIRVPGYLFGFDNIQLMWLVVSVLDEGVVIRFQLSPQGQQFPIIPAGLFPDRHKNFAQSLYDMLLPMHDIATWLMRSRIDNVQAALTNLIFVDPNQVSVPDLINRNPWGVVPTLAGAKPGDGVHVVQVPDVTAGHWNDIAALQDLQQRLSAASDAQQGVPTGDVRTATEIQRLTQLGSQRLGVLARAMSATSIRPAVHMMVGNIQDTLAYEGSINVSDGMAPEVLRQAIDNGYLDFTIKDLQGKLSYLVVDGTLPLEPSRDPRVWLDAIQICNQAGLGMELDLKQMALESIKATGISDVERFRISDEQMKTPSPSQQIQLLNATKGASVMPDEALSQQAQAGNLIPFSTAAREGARGRARRKSGASP